MSTTANTIPPYVFEQKGTHPGPFTFDVPGSLEVRPATATAKFDGTGASGAFLACLTMLGSDGERLGRWFNPTILQPGDVAEVTYTPPFGSAAVSAAPGAGIKFDTEPQSGDWLDIETTGADAETYGFNFKDNGGNGFQLVTAGGGFFYLDNAAGGTFLVDERGTLGIDLNTALGVGRIQLISKGSIALVDDSAVGLGISETGAGGVSIEGTTGGLTLKATGGNVTIILPTVAGPSGTLWNNAGVVSVAP